MKHIKEYEDNELEDLAGDLEDIGHERLRGWLLIGGSDNGFLSGSMYFAHNNQELEKIIKEEYKLWANHPSFPVYKNGDYLRGSRKYESFFEAFVDFLSYEEVFMTVFNLSNLIPKKPEQVPGRINFSLNNPYLGSSFIDDYITNAREMFTDRDEMDEFKDFLTIIPLKK
jgi:hypothetical protein